MRSTLRATTYCGLCRSLEHQTHDYEERGAEEGAMLAKSNVPASSEVGLMAASIGLAHGDGKEEWNADSGTTFHMSQPARG